MSRKPRSRIAKKNYTYRDYLDLPEDGKRCEVINGELAMAPAPNPGHQSVGVTLMSALGNFAEEHECGKVFHAPIDVVFQENIVLQPDIMFIANANLGIITEKKEYWIVDPKK
jgi:Uma2 family endonuclease